MKKIIIFFLSSLLILTGIALAPHLLKLERVQDILAEQLEVQFGNRINIGKIEWDWLPIPHLSLQNAKIDNDQAVCNLPEIIIHPRWTSLFSKEITIKKILLNHPRIHLKRAAIKSDTSNWFPWPTKIIVNNGIVSIDDDLKMVGISIPAPLQFAVNHGEIAISENWLYFDIDGSTTLAKHMGILGKLDISRNAYLARIKCQGLQLHKLTNLAHGRLVPIEKEVNFTAHVAGSGLDTITARLQGEFPSFLVKSEDKQLLLSGGLTDLTLAKNGDAFSVHINEFELKEPGLTLYGTIERHIPNTADNPLWHIDLQAKDLNLSQIRDSILTLWAENETADEVLNIVLGGRARTASFIFDGPVADFHSLHAMTIAADIISAPIFVPEAELNLTEASGTILIKNGILSGENLNATLDASRGSNCSLLLGLTGHVKPFRLELDIDADLAALPAVLHRVIHHAGLKKELDRFSNVRGRGVGHLSIGDTLEDPVVKITADTINATLNYNRITWPVTLQEGSFSLAPGRASWQKVKGVIGPHSIDAAGGVVAWGKGITTKMTIELPAATIDSAALFSELVANDFLPDSLAKNITAVKGMVDLQNVSLFGPARFPRKWVYHLNAKTKELQWDGPMLPSSATLKNTSAFISSNELTLTDSTAFFVGQPFKISAQFTHTLLEDWQGRMTVDGTLNRKIGPWLRQKNWIPVTYFPRLPCTLKQFNITWDERPVEIAGTIIAGNGGQQTAMATVMLTTYGQTLLPKEITFQNRSRRGHLTLAMPTTPPRGLRLNWDGELGADTLQVLFENNILTGGVLRGNFRLDTASDPKVSFLDGMFETENLSWPFQHGKTAGNAVLDLRVQGKDNLLAVNKLDLDLDANHLSLVGKATRSAKGLDVNLQLAAPQASRKNIMAFLADLKNKANRLVTHRSVISTEDRTFSGWDMTGSIAFNIDQFFFTPEATADKIPQEFVHALQPFAGRLVLAAGDNWYAQITRSQLCGIDLTGTLYSDAAFGENNFELSSPHALLFQELLPCLGVEQDLVEGSFRLNGSLRGQSGFWSSGSIDIASSSGRILRMKLLARIFSLINITDLFTAPDSSTNGQKGFPYTDLDLKTVIRDNRLIITKCVIRGEGLNLFAKGDIGLAALDADFTVLIAPLKTIDTVVGHIPLVGRAIGGKNTALVTIPVGIKGNIEDPEVTLLPAQAVGEGIINLVQETLKLPFSILTPSRPENQSEAPVEPAQ